MTQQVASYRVSCKLLSVLLAVFIELAQKVIWNNLFCVLYSLSSIKSKSALYQAHDQSLSSDWKIYSVGPNRLSCQVQQSGSYCYPYDWTNPVPETECVVVFVFVKG